MPENERRLCPLRPVTATQNKRNIAGDVISTQSTTTFAPCEGKRCAWWDSEALMCAVTAIPTTIWAKE